MKKNKVLICVLTISLAVNLITLLQIVRGINSGQDKQSAAVEKPGIEEVNFKSGQEFDSVSVLFKTPMNRNSVPVEFQPPLKYESKWLDRRRLHLTIKEKMVPGKKYYVKTFTDSEDMQGRKTAGQFREFFSSPLKVEKTVCSFNDGRRADIVINFNGKLDRNNLKKYLKVTGSNGHTRNYRFIAAAVKNNQFKIQVNTEDDDFLKVDIGPELKADKAEKPLGSGYTRKLILNKELSIVSVSSTGRSFDPKFRINFNRAVDTEAARNYIEISPKTAFSVNSAYSLNTVELSGDFEPRTTYTFTFKKGLTSKDKSQLKEAVVRTARSGDLKPGFSIMSAGPFYPSGRKFRLPLRVVSLKKLKVSVTKVYPNNVVQFFNSGNYQAYKVGKEVFKQEVETGVAQNEDKKIYLDLTNAIGDQKGIYVVNVKNENYWDYDKITVIRTDLGMSLAKTEKDLQIWTMNLNSGLSEGRVNITLLSYHNQEIANVVSDRNGLASIKLASLSEKPYLLKLEKDGDVSYRGLENSISLGAFDMDYRNYSTNSYQAHIFAERDICRPGESLDFSIILRDKTKKAAGGFPLEAVARSIDGRVIFSKMLNIPASGFLSQKIDISADTRTGHYYFELKIPGKNVEDEEIVGSMRFLVNTYTPDTFKVKIRREDKVLTSTIIPVDLEAVYNFGGSLPGGDVYTSCNYSKVPFKSKNFKGYTFGDSRSDSKYWSEKLELNREGRSLFHIDMEKGKVLTEVPADGLRKPAANPSCGILKVTAEVTDSTGQTVSASTSIRYMSSPYEIGISREKADSEKAVFKWVRVNAKDEETGSSDVMKWTVLRKKWRYHYKQNSSGDYVWDWQCEKTVVKEGEITESGGSGFLNAGTFKEGMYEFIIEAPKEVRTVLPFDIGRNASDVRLGNSEFIKLYSDKNSYSEKDSAVIRFESPAAGIGLLRVAGSRLQKQQTYKVKKGWNSLKTVIPETADGNVYAALTLVRKLDEQLFLPPRFFGLLNLKLNHSDKELKVEIEAPEKVEPGQIVKAKIKVSGKNPTGKVKLMAVDEGVLSLTAFKTPGPFQFFYGKRALKAEFMDVFDDMFPEIKENFGTVSLAGGGGGGAVFRGGNFDIVKSHTVSLGIADTDANGVAELEFTAPDFNGSMRIMAIAVNDEAAGHAERELKVKDKVTIISGSVKALTPGDLVTLPYTLFNNESRELTGSITVSTEGPIEVIRGGQQKKNLKPAEFVNGEVQFNAGKKFGKAALIIEFKAENIISRKRLEFIVRPANARISTGHSGRVEPGKTLDLKLSEGFIEGTTKSTLIVSTSSASEMYTYFEQLQQYPYGCLEQTTSRAIVNLYGSILSSGDREQSKHIVEAALSRLTLMQQHNGGFSMWPNSTRVWQSASVYAAQFIMECKNSGIEVDPLQLKKVTGYLERLSENQIDSNPNDRAYALYILSRLGKKTSTAAFSLLNDSNSSLMAKILACGALAAEGKNAKAAGAFKKLDISKISDQRNNWDMGNIVRRLALTAQVSMDIFGIDSQSSLLCEQLIKSVRNRKWMTTHDKAMVCITIGKKAILQNENPDAEAVVSEGGKQVSVKSGKDHISSSLNIKRKTTIKNSDKGPVFYSYFASGIPETAGSSESHGITLERDYLNIKDEKTAAFKVGELIKVKLKVKSVVDLKNAVILDLLPGCLAVESSMLKSRNGYTEVKNGTIKHYEGLDDRMVVCADLKAGNTLEFVYTARVVATGQFKICGLSAEGMYRPELRAFVNENEVLKVAKAN